MATFDKLYSFTTENISGYIKHFSLNNKSLLTVGSSGDQVINASLKGCHDSTIMDISPNTKNYYYLKIACLLNLNMNEFLTFLCPTHYKEYYRINHELFDKTVFNRIKNTLKELDIDAYMFWDKMFDAYSPREILGNLFLNDIISAEEIKKSNLYLNSELAFDEAKVKIKNMNTSFIIRNIKDVRLTKTYDNMWFSNIGGDYMEIHEFVDTVSSLSKNLNLDGKILVSYLYRVTKQNSKLKTCKDTFHVDDLLKLLKENNLKTRTYMVDGVCKTAKDAVLIHKKTR